MNDIYTQIKQAKKFAHKWANFHGNEKGKVGDFWYGLLGDVFGLPNVYDYFDREKEVLSEKEKRALTEKEVIDFYENPNNKIRKKKKKSKDYIDGYIKQTRVLVEQKAPKWPLDKPEPRKELGGYVTPFQQASIYNGNLSYDERARFIITCNFHEIWIYNLSKNTHPTPTKISVANLSNKLNLSRLYFLIDVNDMDTASITGLSKRASFKIAEIYKALVNQCKRYGTKENGILDNKGNVTNHTLKDLNKLCVRLVFCFYANYSRIFNHKNGFGIFRRYLMSYSDWRQALINLFKVLETPKRSPFDKWKFHYTDGDLFKDDIDIPPIDPNLQHLILQALKFDWSQISPTIFGAMFESTLNPNERKNNGMHYTSIENIRKVINPLFLNDLEKELKAIQHTTHDQVTKAKAFQNKLASLKFLDPACGSGNFLTETYLCLRRLENKAIRIIYVNNYNKNNRYQQWVYHWNGTSNKNINAYQTNLLGDLDSHNNKIIKVNIKQFYGIEVDDFAVSVAKTAMWIAESQMYQQTQDILEGGKDFLPLERNDNFLEADALQTNWNKLVPSQDVNYIISNPPFRGNGPTSKRTPTQKADMKLVMKGMFKNYNYLDFCTCWFKKCADYIKEAKQNGHEVDATLVATNSISQGRQVSLLWKPLNDNYPGLTINYAYRTFKWENDAHDEAHVDCIIISFSYNHKYHKVIYDPTHHKKEPANHINGYLKNMNSLIVTERSIPISKQAPKMDFGNSALSKQNLDKWYKSDVDKVIHSYPKAKQCFKPIICSREYLKNKPRWCLWLNHISSNVWQRIKPINDAVNNTKAYRANSKRKQTREKAKVPSYFAEVRQHPAKNYLIIPSHTSGKRDYIPMSIVSGKDIINASCLFIPNVSYYIFGLLESNVHMIWVNLVAGRIRNDFRYSAKIVYNNFPWPNPTNNKKKFVSRTAKDIIKARKLSPSSSLASLYGNGSTPELIRAHKANDHAVLRLYGLKSNATKSEIMNKLINMYNELTK